MQRICRLPETNYKAGGTVTITLFKLRELATVLAYLIISFVFKLNTCV